MYINKSLNYKLLKLTHRDHQELLSTMEKDSKFLRQHNLMDYSLLLVIEKISAEERSKFSLPRQNQNTERFRNSFFCQEGRQTGQKSRHAFTNEDEDFEGGEYMYHFGIIDYLQVWDFQKKGENKLKEIQGKFDHKSYRKGTISSVPPPQYQERFQQFIKNEVLRFAVQNDTNHASGKEFVDKNLQIIQ